MPKAMRAYLWASKYEAVDLLAKWMVAEEEEHDTLSQLRAAIMEILEEPELVRQLRAELKNGDYWEWECERCSKCERCHQQAADRLYN